jgi:phosphohistidine swiveling domain-containing protein
MKSENWFIFETIFKINPQQVVSFSPIFRGKDWLNEFLTKVLKLKDYPKQKIIFIFRKGDVDLCYQEKRIRKLAEKICQKTIDNPDWGEKSNQEVRLRSNHFFMVGRRILKTDFKKLPTQELNKFYQEYYQANIKMHTSSWYGNLADYDSIFGIYLNDYLRKKLQKSKINQPLSQIFYNLTLSEELSYAQKQEIDLERLLTKIKQRPRLNQFLKNKTSGEMTKKLPEKDQEINNYLDSHIQKYSWLPYQCEGPGWDKRYFLKEIREKLRENINPKLIIQEIENKPKKILERKKIIIKKLNINQKHQKLLKIFTDIVFLRGYRKDSISLGCYARDHLLRELAQRLKIKLKYFRYIYPWEMEKAVLERDFSLSLLKKRFQYHVYFYHENKKVNILVGSKARDFIKKLSWQKRKINKKAELKGTSASPGKAEGRVTIVNITKDMRKMKQGNILVSEATSPDLMPAIKKAQAIVTNVGGITCHAAIISRELNIPCVIGTKIATKVLKDGDLIEVDADEGMVKVINK